MKRKLYFWEAPHGPNHSIFYSIISSKSSHFLWTHSNIKYPIKSDTSFLLGFKLFRIRLSLSSIRVYKLTTESSLEKMFNGSKALFP